MSRNVFVVVGLIGLIALIAIPRGSSSARGAAGRGSNARGLAADQSASPVTETGTLVPSSTAISTSTATPQSSTATPSAATTTTRTPTSVPTRAATTSATPAPTKTATRAPSPVPAAKVSLGSSSVNNGSTIVVQLSAFPKNALVRLTLDGQPLANVPIAKDRTGYFAWYVQNVIGGRHTLRAVSGPHAATTVITVTAYEYVSTSVVVRGTAVIVRVSGFQKGESIALRLYGPQGSANYTTVARFSVDAHGVGKFTYVIPKTATPGVRKLASYGGAGHAGVYLTVLASAKPTATATPKSHMAMPVPIWMTHPGVEWMASSISRRRDAA